MSTTSSPPPTVYLLPPLSFLKIVLSHRLTDVNDSAHRHQRTNRIIAATNQQIHGCGFARHSWLPFPMRGEFKSVQFQSPAAVMFTVVGPQSSSICTKLTSCSLTSHDQRPHAQRLGGISIGSRHVLHGAVIMTAVVRSCESRSVRDVDDRVRSCRWRCASDARGAEHQAAAALLDHRSVWDQAATQPADGDEQQSHNSHDAHAGNDALRK